MTIEGAERIHPTHINTIATRYVDKSLIVRFEIYLTPSPLAAELQNFALDITQSVIAERLCLPTQWLSGSTEADHIMVIEESNQQSILDKDNKEWKGTLSLLLKIDEEAGSPLAKALTDTIFVGSATDASSFEDECVNMGKGLLVTVKYVDCHTEWSLSDKDGFDAKAGIEHGLMTAVGMFVDGLGASEELTEVEFVPWEISYTKDEHGRNACLVEWGPEERSLSPVHSFRMARMNEQRVAGKIQQDLLNARYWSTSRNVRESEAILADINTPTSFACSTRSPDSSIEEDRARADNKDNGMLSEDEDLAALRHQVNTMNYGDPSASERLARLQLVMFEQLMSKSKEQGKKILKLEAAHQFPEAFPTRSKRSGPGTRPRESHLSPPLCHLYNIARDLLCHEATGWPWDKLVVEYGTEKQAIQVLTHKLPLHETMFRGQPITDSIGALLFIVTGDSTVRSSGDGAPVHRPTRQEVISAWNGMSPADIDCGTKEEVWKVIALMFPLIKTAGMSPRFGTRIPGSIQIIRPCSAQRIWRLSCSERGYASSTEGTGNLKPPKYLDALNCSYSVSALKQEFRECLEEKGYPDEALPDLADACMLRMLSPEDLLDWEYKDIDSDDYEVGWDCPSSIDGCYGGYVHPVYLLISLLSLRFQENEHILQFLSARFPCSGQFIIQGDVLDRRSDSAVRKAVRDAEGITKVLLKKGLDKKAAEGRAAVDDVKMIRMALKALVVRLIMEGVMQADVKLGQLIADLPRKEASSIHFVIDMQSYNPFDKAFNAPSSGLPFMGTISRDRPVVGDEETVMGTFQEDSLMQREVLIGKKALPVRHYIQNNLPRYGFRESLAERHAATLAQRFQCTSDVLLSDGFNVKLAHQAVWRLEGLKFNVRWDRPEPLYLMPGTSRLGRLRSNWKYDRGKNWQRDSMVTPMRRSRRMMLKTKPQNRKRRNKKGKKSGRKDTPTSQQDSEHEGNATESEGLGDPADQGREGDDLVAEGSIPEKPLNVKVAPKELCDDDDKDWEYETEYGEGTGDEEGSTDAGAVCAPKISAKQHRLANDAFTTDRPLAEIMAQELAHIDESAIGSAVERLRKELKSFDLQLKSRDEFFVQQTSALRTDIESLKRDNKNIKKEFRSTKRELTNRIHQVEADYDNLMERFDPLFARSLLDRAANVVAKDVGEESYDALQRRHKLASRYQVHQYLKKQYKGRLDSTWIGAVELEGMTVEELLRHIFEPSSIRKAGNLIAHEGTKEEIRSSIASIDESDVNSVEEKQILLRIFDVVEGSMGFIS
ncbi:hypothetical protein BJ508DRAFT_323120 [Ascobolus immersus RN42]|uniref:Uncharacterized protein n=1 Tax=Ascobolus immersus RN42 TaxID=1160509 RepID=A0A3N4IH27_ASCIM|nr:hypothetical protein BJ508DRAFT_323120 [Ascobolus immersus RN42]